MTVGRKSEAAIDLCLGTGKGFERHSSSRVGLLIEIVRNCPGRTPRATLLKDKRGKPDRNRKELWTPSATPL